MKRYSLLLSICIMCFVFFGFGKTNVSASETDVENSLSEISADLENIYQDYLSVSSTIVNNWSTDGSILKYYFDEEHCKNGNLYKDVLRKRDYNQFWDLKNSANEKLEDAKKKIKDIDAIDEVEDYYDAVKDYYKSIYSLRELLSTFPEGYSKMTYSMALVSIG